MAETGGDITGNDDAISLRDFIQGHLDHLDTGIHSIQQTTERIEKHLEAMQADLDAARPLLEKWQRSTLVRRALGQMPWG